MTDIEAKKRARTAFANELYDRSGGSESFYEHYQRGAAAEVTVGS